MSWNTAGRAKVVSQAERNTQTQCEESGAQHPLSPVITLGIRYFSKKESKTMLKRKRTED